MKARLTRLSPILLVYSCGGSGGALFDSTISALSTDSAPSPYGVISTVSTSGPIDFSPNNLFFDSLGSNGRTCGSCHIEAAGWSITPSLARQIAASNPSSPLFNPVDGTDCPLPSNPNPTQNSTELLQHGNIRIQIGIPANAEFTLNGFADFHACATPPNAAALYLYRRPLPSTNLPFLATIMWDGRETTQPTIGADLQHQANDATLGHAQATQSLSSIQEQTIFTFENALFTGQTTVTLSGSTIDLTTGVNGGPDYLALTVAPAFTIGLNDVFSPSFNPNVFTIYAAWEPSAPGFANLTPQQQSIGRGEHTFNTRIFSITDVAGLNGPHDASQAPLQGTCTTCHDNPQVGNHSVSLALDIGVVDASSKSAAGKTLDIRNLPIYTFVNKTTRQVVTVTDPGRALITGKWADIGKTKGPVLRGVAAREPLFHNGSATTIATLISFYNARFNMALSTQERSDLEAFLKAL
jgi:hypothetical protein